MSQGGLEGQRNTMYYLLEEQGRTNTKPLIDTKFAKERIPQHVCIQIIGSMSFVLDISSYCM